MALLARPTSRETGHSSALTQLDEDASIRPGHEDSASMSIELGLDRIQRLLQYLPPYTRPTIHVGGTNGKGSVTSMLSSILLASNPPLSVGRFNSPHLLSVYDSIAINGKEVSPRAYDAARSTVVSADKEHGTRLTNFELLAVTALVIFETAKVDIAVIEVGLGGRLDATNAIPDDSILVSAMTTVGVDHQAFLGNTPSAISSEKAGIARKNKPFILGKQQYPEVYDVVETIVRGVGGDLIRARQVTRREWNVHVDGQRFETTFDGKHFKAPPGQPISLDMPYFPAPIHSQLPLQGAHQLDNLAIASEIVSTLLIHPACAPLGFCKHITADSIAKGIREVVWPGRLSFHIYSTKEIKPIVVLVDGAHNSASAATLSDYIAHLLSMSDGSNSSKTRSINLTFILSLSHSPPKTPLQTLSPLFPLPALGSKLTLNLSVAAVDFTPPDGMPWVKSVPPSEILEVVNGLVPDTTVWAPSDASTHPLEDALLWASTRCDDQSESLVVISGSLYLVADFYRLSGSDLNL
ncbi:folylpolyglutamate synthase [Pleurotus ostreatus]|uniref:Folylpolyglutamate synthase n=2 Tax=Pleurotus TaxID=5320 RepID=A0A8H7DQ26_PLEOS|nr:folylpolyglutamate synthase [Pleurotus ostreatus]KAF7422655.1 folylpolyglutamate synthase [Pleurotus ostreatus]